MNGHTNPQSVKGQDEVTVNFDYSIINNSETNTSPDEFIKDIDKELQQQNEELSKRLNKFPVDVFPSPIQRIISETNENLNFPIDFIGSSLLYAVSVAIGNTHRVEVKRGWVESAVVYLAIVARAGTNKSHPLTFALKPITERDKHTYRQFDEQNREYEKAVRMSRKGKPEEQATEEPVKPTWQKFLLSDFTPEALATIHKFNKRGIGVHVDELAGWFKNFNRYNKGSEMEFWLSVWSGKPINIDRKTGDPVFIPLPFISVAGTIQNGLLHELAKDSRNQNGFIDRILFVIPDNVQKTYWSDTDLHPMHAEKWSNILSKILDLSINIDETLNPEPEELKFSPEAKRILFEWQKKNTDKSNEAENEELSGIFSKLEIYVVRLALIIEMMRFACNESSRDSISVAATQGAIKLVEYFRNSAAKVNSILSHSTPLDMQPQDKRSLFDALPNTFTTGEGQSIAEQFGIPERTYKRFLNGNGLFIRNSHGKYEKKFQNS